MSFVTRLEVRFVDQVQWSFQYLLNLKNYVYVFIFFILPDTDRHSLVSNSATPWPNSLPGSSVHGIIQARILEWAAISFLA